MVKTNNLKKGTKVILKNGWNAVLMDNRKGNIRLAEVDGLYKEVGSIYSYDISSAEVDGKWQGVLLTDKQLEAQVWGDMMGF